MRPYSRIFRFPFLQMYHQTTPLYSAQEDIGLSDINEMLPYQRAPMGTNTSRDKTRLIQGLQNKQRAKRVSKYIRFIKKYVC